MQGQCVHVCECEYEHVMGKTGEQGAQMESVPRDDGGFSKTVAVQMQRGKVER